MKNLIIILIALLMAGGAMAQWVPLNSGTTNHLSSVYFIDSRTGYAVGNSGTILKTTNGGSNWIVQYSGTIQNLLSAFFWDSMAGYCVGDSGTILNTVDGGENWNVQVVDTNIILHSICFPSESTGYIAGERTTYVAPFQHIFDAIVLKTTDYGINWNENFITEGLLSSICFPSPEIGYAGGGMPETPGYDIFLKTIDGGENWTVDENVPGGFYSSNLGSLCFINVDTGYAVAGGVLQTYNGGQNWSLISPGGGWIVTSIYFMNDGIGYGIGYNIIGGIGGIYKTVDDGENWVVQDSTLSSMPYAIYFPVTDTGYIVGADGLILKTTNGGLPVGIDSDLLNLESFNLYPNPSSRTISIELPKPITQQRKTTLTIIDIAGKQIVQRQITEQQTMVDVSALNTGIYFVKVVSDDGVQVRKFVKE